MRSVAFLSILVLCGCATSPEQQLAAAADQWHGQSIARAVERFGMPTSSFPRSDGTRAFIWERRAAVVTGYGATSYTCPNTLYATHISGAAGTDLSSWIVVDTRLNAC